MRRAALLAGAGIVWLAASAAAADIYRWTDEHGVAHFTTSVEGVPDEARADVRPFVRERPRAPLPPPAPQARTTEESAPAALAPAASDPIEDRLSRAFAAGVEAGAVERSSPVVEVHPAPVVQNVVVEAPEISPRWVVGALVPVGPRFPRRPAPPPGEEPVSRAPILRGPAGPPPIGAAGPPPVGALR